MKRLPYILSILLAGVVSAQTIYVTDQNIFDLNPSRDAISGLAGAQRIKASFWEDNSYTIPIDISGALPITLTISSTVDDYTVSVLNSATSTPPNVVWWVVPFLNAGSYRAQATAVFPGDQFPVFDRFLTLTNVPVQPTSFFLTNEVTVGAVSVTNIFGDTIITNVITSDIIITNITQFVTESNTVVYTSGVSSVSVTGAVDGALTFEGNAVTQTGTTFNFSYVDTDTDDGFTNIVIEGSGNVVTNLVYGGRVVTQQLGTVSGGGGGLDHWAASNTADATYLYPTGANHNASRPYIVAYTNSGVSIAGNGSSIASIAGGIVAGVNNTISSPGSYHAIVGGNANSINAAGGRAVIVGGKTQSITAGNEELSILGGTLNSIQNGRFGATIAGGYANIIAANGTATFIAGGYGNQYSGTGGGDYNSIFGGGINDIESTEDYNSIIGGYENDITGATFYSTVIGGYDADNSASYTFSSGYQLNNTHAGTYMFRTYDADATEWSSAATNTFIVKTGGLGINTNNPQADLHVNGMVQIDGVKVYASGTNLYLTDGSTYTNLITTTPL